MKLFLSLCLSATLLFSEVQSVDAARTKQNTLNDKNNTQKSTISATEEIDNPETIALKREKLNLLIKQFNRFSAGAYRVYPYYQRYFGINPDKYKQSRSGYLVEFFQKLKKTALTEAKKIPILDELNPMIDEYYNKGIHLQMLHNTAYEYYDMKDYKNDKYKKAKEMHKPLVVAYQDFFLIDEKIKTKVEEIQDALDLDYFKKLKKQGHIFAYIKGMSLQASKKFLKSVSGKEIKEINLEKIEQQLSQIRYFYDELKTFKDKDPEKYERLDFTQPFYKSLKEYTISAKSLTFRVKEKRPYTQKEKRELSSIAAWMVRSSSGEVLDKYNRLVTAYNR